MNITSDRYIHKIIQGYEPTSYKSKVFQVVLPSNIVSEDESQHMDSLLEMNVIERCTVSEDQFLSNIFLVKKSDGSYCKILNLKNFTKFMVHKHLKMESLDAALDLVYQNSYFASADLRKAYYSVAMSQNFCKYLRFEWRGILY